MDLANVLAGAGLIARAGLLPSAEYTVPAVLLAVVVIEVDGSRRGSIAEVVPQSD